MGIRVSLDLPFENLGAQLRSWRRLRGVKQAALADRLSVTQSTLSRWEAGRTEPPDIKKSAIRDLLRARPSGAQDFALRRLVETSGLAVHLVCDTTHELLAASRAREGQWRISASDLAGRSLWRFRTEAFELAEHRLKALGWFDCAAGEFHVETERRVFEELTIEAGPVTCTRHSLSDGRYARLVIDG